MAAAINNLVTAIILVANEIVPCTQNVDCLTNAKLSSMPGIMSQTCVSAQAMPTGITSVCSFTCSAGYAQLVYPTGSDFLHARSCFNTVIPTACASTTPASGTSTSTGSTCSTPTVSAAPFSTATFANQHCKAPVKIAELGGDSTCVAICPQSYTLTKVDTTAHCTLTSTTTTELPSSALDIPATASISFGTTTAPVSSMTDVAITTSPSSTVASTTIAASRSTVNVVVGKAAALKPASVFVLLALLLIARPPA